MSEQASGVGRQASGPRAPKWAWWVATGFGSGYLKPAPGTWGSLAALVVWVTLVAAPWFLSGQPDRSEAVGLIWILTPILIWLAIWSSNLVVDELGEKDPSFIVADEWAGLWVALLPSSLMIQGGLYLIRGWENPLCILAAPIFVPFLLFRLFDIWKPWPIFQLQSLPRGWGVVVDDLVAGLYAAIGTLLLMPWFPMGPGKG